MENPEWLAEWIQHQLAASVAQAVMLPGVAAPAIYFHGSLGYDSAITTTGDVWVSEYELGEPAGPWRLSGAKERIGYLVCAARRRPELRRLLPSRPSTQPNCEACDGTCAKTFRLADGTKVVPVTTMICDVCAGLGWVAA